MKDEYPASGELSPHKHLKRFGRISAVLAGIAGTFIRYCEKLQLAPYTVRGLTGRLVISFSLLTAVFLLFYFVIRKSVRRITKKEWLPIILVSLVISVCIMIWFPVPNTGIYPEHTLEIRALPDENGNIRPVTLTWLHGAGGDVPFKAIRCSGNCSEDPIGWTLQDAQSVLSWTGTTGDQATVEFAAAQDQGIAQISWDGRMVTAPLNNEELSRLSFDHAFPASDGFAEFIAVWYISFILCFAAVLFFIKLLPEWDLNKFGSAAFLCFVIFRIFQFLTVSQPLLFFDSESYLGMSRMPVSDILRGTQYCHDGIWYCIARPAFIPLVYKLCRQDPHTITIVQLVISLICWGFFSRQTSSLCRTGRGKKAAVILTLGLGCIPNVTRWDTVLMSESLSISAALLMMGGLFGLTRPVNGSRKIWRWTPAVLTAFGALLYAQSRDSAVWSVILTAILLLFICRLRKERKVILLLCAVLAGICWSVMSSTGGRWQFPFENVLFNRIVRDPQSESFFLEAGMPTPPGIEKLYGVEHMMSSELFNSEGMTPLRDWIRTEGLKTYIRYMLAAPIGTLRMAWDAGFEKEAFEQISYTFAPKGFRPLMPDPVIRFFSANLPAVLIIGSALAGIWIAFRKTDGERYAFPLLFVLSAYILSSGVLIADEYEFARHSMVIILMMKASAWPILIMLLEDSCRKPADTPQS